MILTNGALSEESYAALIEESGLQIFFGVYGKLFSNTDCHSCDGSMQSRQHSPAIFHAGYMLCTWTVGTDGTSAN